MKLVVGKYYRTRVGGLARIYALDGRGEYSAHGAMQQHDGWWEQEQWTEDGQFSSVEGSNDLVAEVLSVAEAHKVVEVFLSAYAAGPRNGAWSHEKAVRILNAFQVITEALK